MPHRSTGPEGLEAPRAPDRPDPAQRPPLARRALFRQVAGLGAALPLAALAGVSRSARAAEPQAAAHGETVAPAPAEPTHAARWRFFEPAEARFVEAAVARLIPSGESRDGAPEAQAAVYIERALAGAWGGGDGLYRTGPWQAGTPQQGYQLPFTPAQLYRSALRALDRLVAGEGPSFDRLDGAAQDAWLTRLEKGSLDLDGIPSAVFFDYLLRNTLEGWLSDPVYGGNRDAIGWKAIGFPGAYESWADLVDQHGIDLSERQRAPLSIADAPAHAAHAVGMQDPARTAGTRAPGRAAGGR